MSNLRNTGSRRARRLLAGAALTAGLTVGSAGGALAADPDGPGGLPPSKTVPTQERRLAKSTPIQEIKREADPLQTPRVLHPSTPEPEGPDGPRLKVPGTAPSAARDAAGVAAAPAPAAAAQNGLWAGTFGTNPNRQVGKLYFDVQRGPGVTWSHCSATAVNSENKSMVVTAGHCVYNPDPDKDGDGRGDGIVEGDGFWYENVQFCPGYEYGCRLGIWYARQMYTTNSWFYGTGTPRRYDWSDDMAIVLVSPNPQGYLVNAQGGHGITFNGSTGLDRHAFGYPASDRRFPAYAYNGEDLVYCPGRDSYDGAGHVGIGCTMTGGASGGPWLHSPNAGWLGTLNGVNSHKVSAQTMSSPYFGSAESDLFQYARAR
jgi:hypothetical protein